MDKGENFWTVERIVEWHKKNERIEQLREENEGLRKELRNERRTHLANLLDADAITPEQYEKAVAEINALLADTQEEACEKP